MKIYKVAHENIICPKEYRKIEIEKEYVKSYIIESVAFQDMIESMPGMSSIGPVEEEEYADYIISNWLSNQADEFYRQGYYNLGDFDLVIER